jgi:long-chain acyl-CoA synthetase
MNYGTIVRQHARSRPEDLAMVDGEWRLTWREFDQRANRAANFLNAIECGEGQRILWFAQNSFRLFEMLIAAARVGAMLVPVNWRVTAAELEFMLKDLDPRLVIWQDEEIGAVAREVRARNAVPARWLQHEVVGGDDTYEGALRDFPDTLVDPHTDVATPMLAIYTAAFAGHPNAAMISQNAMMLQDVVIAIAQQIDHTTSYLAAGPLFHIGAFMAASATLHMGGTNVVVARADAKLLLELIRDERCTHGFIPGPTIEQMRALNQNGEYDVSSMWSAPNAPEWTNPIVTPASAPWAKNLGGYGQTEVQGLVTMACFGGRNFAGKPTPFAEVAVFNSNNEEVAFGETGEIRVRGPMVMCGYYNRPELNASRIRNGWHCTQDLGRYNPDGSITFVGPMMKMIKSASENIYPIEVENALRAHPAVADVCVIGVPDPRWEQSVKALVVLKEGAQVDADTLINHCKELIASYKKPKIVQFVDQLEKTNGMVDRDRMDELYGGGGYPKM